MGNTKFYLTNSPKYEDIQQLIIPLFDDKNVFSLLPHQTRFILENIIKENPKISNKGKFEKIILPNTQPVNNIILLGMGKTKDVEISDFEDIFSNIIESINLSKLGFLFNPLNFRPEIVLEKIIISLKTALYKLDILKSERETKNIDSLQIITKKIINKSYISKGEILGDAINFVRELTILPSNIATPEYIIDRAKQFLPKSQQLKIEVFDEKQILRKKMEGIYNVGKCSINKPKLLIIKYIPNPKNKEIIGFAGKGLTFDSGGISLKHEKGMAGMKSDMAGAAAVIGAMFTIANLNLKKNIIALVPLVENLPGGNAYKPGDVLTLYNKKTVEIISTDAEGRLILADALSYAEELGASIIIDTATLTGACIIALGNLASGIMGNDQNLINKLIKIGHTQGEKMWQLPLFSQYKELIKSEIADIRNSAGSSIAGTIIGGIFLKEFVKKAKWAHIDIAGTVSKKAEQMMGETPTAVPLRTLVEFALS